MISMPAVIVLIVCKTVATPYASTIDQENANYTGHQPREWATEHAMMVCRRQELRLQDSALAQATPAMPVAAQPFNIQRCQRSGIMLGTQWDAAHRASRYRFWRVACPVPIINTITGEIIAWKMPECGHRDTVRCEVDSEI